MPQKLYRGMMALRIREGHRSAVTLRAGQILEVLGPAEDDRFVQIQVDGEVLEAFELDVADRCYSDKNWPGSARN